jgi:hypothetical protein
MFNNTIKEFAKLDVLESKLNIYESLSREMLDKLENAVDKISESNQRIATILTKHDERIEQSIKTDELIVKMIEDVKHSNSREHQSVIKRIESIELSISELSKFKWQVLALAGASILIMGWIVPFIDKNGMPTYNGSNQTHDIRK